MPTDWIDLGNDNRYTGFSNEQAYGIIVRFTDGCHTIVYFTNPDGQTWTRVNEVPLTVDPEVITLGRGRPGVGPHEHRGRITDGVWIPVTAELSP